MSRLWSTARRLVAPLAVGAALSLAMTGCGGAAEPDTSPGDATSGESETVGSEERWSWL